MVDLSDHKTGRNGDITMKQYTLEEYIKENGIDFFVYDETIDDYILGETGIIDTDLQEWEQVKNEPIIVIDDKLNEKPTLVIASYIEEEEKDWEEGLSDSEIRDAWEAYWANLSRDERAMR